MCTPFQWTKQVASHWGSTRNGTIVHWPRSIDERGCLRSQSTHVIDVAPTILEAAGLPEPTMVNGVQQSPSEGTSMLHTFNDAAAPERHDLQYFERFADRGMYHNCWSAVTKHRTPWIMVGGKLPAFDDVWELYDGSHDDSQARYLAADEPDRLATLQRLWLIEAKYTVDVGYESGTTVSADYTARESRFTGKIHWVQIDLGLDDHDQFIDPERTPLHRHGEAVEARLRLRLQERSRP